MPDKAYASLTASAYSRLAYGFLALFMVVVLTGVSYLSHKDRESQLAFELQRAQSNALVMEDQATQTLQLIENMIRALPELSGTPLNKASPQELNSLLLRMQFSQPALRSLSIMTEQEGIRASTHMANLGLKPPLYTFTPNDSGAGASSVLRLGPVWEGRDLYNGRITSAKQPGAANSPYFIPLVLRLGAGREQVWVVATLNPDYLLNRFSRYSQSETDGYELVRFDGNTLLTSAELPLGSVFSLPALLPEIQRQEIGTYMGELLTAFRASSRYPFFVLSHVRRDLVLSQWVHRTWELMGWTLAALIAVLGITMYLTHRLKVSERAERQQRFDLARSRDKAEAATRAKSDFLANMSHEIRTPMNGIIGMTQLALEQHLAPQADTYVRSAHTAAVSLLGILNDILDFSKIEAGKLQIESVDFNLKQLIDEVLSIQRIAAQAKGLEVSCRIDLNVPRWIKADPLRLSQVLNNLIGNAVKFTPRGAVRVLVSLADHYRLCVEVQDDGVGMSEEQLLHLFQPFSQADTSTTRLYGGTGLGLAISQHLSEHMGGHIDVKSTLGQGSQFTLELPFKVAEKVPAVSGSQTADSDSPSHLAGVRVLLVEDHALNRQLLLALLNRVHVHTEFAVNGQEAIDKLNASPDGFDLVLMDVQMPVMDGITATRQLRADSRFSNLPIIAVTANAMSDERGDCLDAGMQDYLVKPIDRHVLYQTMARWVVLKS
ncbi:hypothetical protein B9Z39_06005 [Limnohabitans sp. JirII-29]|nr:hypothetical protein B9Z39_06005 [Limnohabitans sp. JirII-29]